MRTCAGEVGAVGTSDRRSGGVVSSGVGASTVLPSVVVASAVMGFTAAGGGCAGAWSPMRVRCGSAVGP